MRTIVARRKPQEIEVWALTHTSEEYEEEVLAGTISEGQNGTFLSYVFLPGKYDLCYAGEHASQAMAMSYVVKNFDEQRGPEQPY